ncbi:MAG: metal ABC transporter solute-binding protein, Zn/Mn family [Planctomycetota bacterium]|jgi:manganese/zinc/iron transport system substrate-binding protein
MKTQYLIPHLIVCSLILAPLMLSGCKRSETTPSGDTAAASSGTPKLTYPYTITATVGMVSDVIQQVAGDLANVSNIIGEGVDPHLYKPTSADMKQLMAGDAIAYAGLFLEGQMGDMLDMNRARGKTVFAVTELIDEKYLLFNEASYGKHPDPHVWMDVSAWQKAVDAIRDQLSAFDPGNADTYAANAAAYNMKLDALHAYGLGVMATIPQESRVMVTAHDAFSYFGRAYGVEVMGIQGLSTESEAGIQRINELVDMIVERGVRAVFVETSVSEKNIEALIEGSNARLSAAGKPLVKKGGLLFSDAMGPAGGYTGTYVGMLDHNLTTVARALGGKAPGKGFNGQLENVDDPH